MSTNELYDFGDRGVDKGEVASKGKVTMVFEFVEENGKVVTAEVIDLSDDTNWFMMLTIVKSQRWKKGILLERLIRTKIDPYRASKSFMMVFINTFRKQDNFIGKQERIQKTRLEFMDKYFKDPRTGAEREFTENQASENFNVEICLNTLFSYTERDELHVYGPQAVLVIKLSLTTISTYLP